jgi:hypothetical protein
MRTNVFALIGIVAAIYFLTCVFHNRVTAGWPKKSYVLISIALILHSLLKFAMPYDLGGIDARWRNTVIFSLGQTQGLLFGVVLGAVVVLWMAGHMRLK